MSTISASTTSTTAYKVTADTTGTLVFQTGATPTTAMTLGADQSVTFAGTPTYTGGTANGVAYLNGSKVLTTGSALVFDGTNLGIGTSSPSSKLTVNGNAAVLGGNKLYLWNAANNSAPYIANNGSISFYNTSDVLGMSLDGSGNLGLGVTPSAWGSTNKAIDLGTYASFGYRASNGLTVVAGNLYINASDQFILKTTNPAALYQMGATGEHYWYNSPSGTAGSVATVNRLMTLDGSGNLLVGRTSAGSRSAKVSIAANSANNDGLFIDGWGAGIAVALTLSTAVSSSSTAVAFNYSGTEVGSIKTTSTATSYITSSDYRLKNKIAPMTGALAKVTALKPVTYKWNLDDSEGEGFIAHELAEVCPYAVTGEKDAVDDEGKPVYQGIDTSFLVATLTAAIQEQQAIIQQLQADVATLKGAA